MANPTTTEYTLPTDIADIYSMLGWMLSDLTDLMVEEVREWRGELHQALRDWKAGGTEPDWQNFRDWMNDICDDDGMPKLFAAEKPPDAHLEATYEDRISGGGCND